MRNKSASARRLLKVLSSRDAAGGQSAPLRRISMKPLLYGWRYAAVCSLLVGLPVYAACGPSAATSSSDATEAADYEIQFSKMYSAYADGHDFKLPARIEGVKNIKWSCDPAGVVEFEKGT